MLWENVVKFHDYLLFGLLRKYGQEGCFLIVGGVSFDGILLGGAFEI